MFPLRPSTRRPARQRILWLSSQNLLFGTVRYLRVLSIVVLSCSSKSDSQQLGCHLATKLLKGGRIIKKPDRDRCPYPTVSVVRPVTKASIFSTPIYLDRMPGSM